jgi:hypothetical protein
MRNTAFLGGAGLGVLLGVALYFAIVAVLPKLAALPWIIT